MMNGRMRPQCDTSKYLDDRWTLVRVRVGVSSLVRWFPLLQSVCDITWSHSRVTACAWQLSRFIICDPRALWLSQARSGPLGVASSTPSSRYWNGRKPVPVPERCPHSGFGICFRTRDLSQGVRLESGHIRACSTSCSTYSTRLVSGSGGLDSSGWQRLRRRTKSGELNNAQQGGAAAQKQETERRTVRVRCCHPSG